MTIFSTEFASFRGRVGFGTRQSAITNAREYVRDNVPRKIAKLQDRNAPPLRRGSRITKITDLEWALHTADYVFIGRDPVCPSKVCRMARKKLQSLIDAGRIFFAIEIQ